MRDVHLANKIKENFNFLRSACSFALGLVDEDFFYELIYHGRGQLGKVCIFSDKGKKLFGVDGFPAYAFKFLLVLGNDFCQIA